MHMHELPYPPVAGARATAVSGLRGGAVFTTTDWVAEEVPVAQPSEWQQGYQRFNEEQLQHLQAAHHEVVGK